MIDHFSQIRYKKILLAQENSSLIKVWEGLKTRGGNEQVKQVNNIFCQGLNIIWIKGEGSNKVWLFDHNISFYSQLLYSQLIQVDVSFLYKFVLWKEELINRNMFRILLCHLI